MTTSDGKWYCFRVSGEKLREIDERESCWRTLDRCKRIWKLADDHGLNPTACKPYVEAVCLKVKFPDVSEWREVCFITGEECERIAKLNQGRNGQKIKPCAIEKNDAPPKGPTV